jgi:Protein of unknown function (DUF3429)
VRRCNNLADDCHLGLGQFRSRTTTGDVDTHLPRVAFLLGLSGLLPQIAAVALTFVPWVHGIAIMSGFFYAALIFSFLGGMWWGIAAVHPAVSRWLYVVAVVPSLIAFAGGGLWFVTQGLSIPLVVIGSGLLASPLVDQRLDRLGLLPRGWLKMRVILSVGLGVLTLVLATLA